MELRLLHRVGTLMSWPLVAFHTVPIETSPSLPLPMVAISHADPVAGSPRNRWTVIFFSSPGLLSLKAHLLTGYFQAASITSAREG
jgi:hypothetical protein